MNNCITQAQIDLRARYFYLACVFIFCVRFYASTLFSQLSQPVLIHPGIDNTYWLFHLLGVPRLATSSYLLSTLLDMALFFVPLIASFTSNRRFLAIGYTLVVLIYQVTFSTYSMHHYHGLIGVLFLSIPFWCGPGERFLLLWQAARYYFFFIFASASLWKLTSGSLWQTGQMSHILMSQHAQYLYDYPASMGADLYRYLISHPGLSQALLISAFLLQASFWGGFFTRRFDRIYLILFILFFAVNYLLMHIFSIELFILCLLLLDWDKIEKKQTQVV